MHYTSHPRGVYTGEFIKMGGLHWEVPGSQGGMVLVQLLYPLVSFPLMFRIWLYWSLLCGLWTYCPGSGEVGGGCVGASAEVGCV